MISKEFIETLKKSNKVLFVALPTELSKDDTTLEVIHTGVGKMRMYAALVKWYEQNREQIERDKPIVLNIGTAGSAKYQIGELLECSSFTNGGSEFILDTLETSISKDKESTFSGDYFMSTKTFNEDEVHKLEKQYTCFEMEAFAAALFCKTHDLKFACVKGISDNLDGEVKDWDNIVSHLRVKFAEFCRQIQ